MPVALCTPCGIERILGVAFVTNLVKPMLKKIVNKFRTNTFDFSYEVDKIGNDEEYGARAITESQKEDL